MKLFDKIIIIFSIVSVSYIGYIEGKARILGDLRDTLEEAGIIRFYVDTGNPYLEDSSGINLYLWELVKDRK